jgi:hypothetical protein
MLRRFIIIVVECLQPNTARLLAKAQNHRGSLIHHDSQHQTFSSLTNAVDADIEQLYQKFRPADDPDEETINLNFYYPLLVLQGELYIVREDDDSADLDLRSASHVQYIREIWTSQKRETYQIDVIQEQFLPEYLALVEGELAEHKEAAQPAKEGCPQDDLAFAQHRSRGK